MDRVSDAGSIETRTPLALVAGVGPRTAERLAHLGLHTAGDLVRHLPLRHERRLAERSILETMREVSQSEAQVRLRGQIARVRVRPGPRGMVEATLEDGSATARLVWFNAPWMRGKLHPGDRGVAEGKGRMRGGYLELGNPRWTAEERADTHAGGDDLRPIYPASEEIGSSEIEALVGKVLGPVCAGMVDPLPEVYRASRDLPRLAEAWRAMHQPRGRDELEGARRRLAFDELLLLQLGVMMRRAQLRARTRAVSLPVDARLDAHIRARIPFTLTDEQDRVVGEISHDLARPEPMNRLLQGDVGSGKTAVATYAMLLAAANGHQAALVAPTEILAEQHHEVLRRMLAGSDLQLRLLTGSTAPAERTAIVAGLARGSVHLVVGTHAVLEGGVAFRSLAVAVIDEQHRFGVRQRAAIRQKGQGEQPLVPHTLVMTATPIPRTLAITLYGDLDLSTLRGKPPGRRPAITRVVDMGKAPEVYAYLRGRIDRGEQCFVVVPAVEESEQGLKDVASHARFLAQGPFAGLEITSVHGRMHREEREQAMERFHNGQARVLVATTVIEVGVDVPNASLMVVEHAERFGLAQLHQLRGRVGRGTTSSLCVFIGDAATPDAAERLQAIGGSDDGFDIAERDLRLRGPGEVFGARQSGLAPFRVADLSRDAELLRLARADAGAWIDRDPDLQAPESLPLRRKLMHLHGQALGLADVG
jgi:ATP-dependent DNA helicase RecG